MLGLGQYVWKVADRRKNPWCTKTASNLQPSDLRLNAYRSLLGNQDISPCFFSCIYIHRNPRKRLIILKYFLWNLMDIVLFIKALQHMCWRSVGHQVLCVISSLYVHVQCMLTQLASYARLVFLRLTPWCCKHLSSIFNQTVRCIDLWPSSDEAIYKYVK